MKIGPLLLFLAFLVVPPLLSALGRWLQQQFAEAGGGGRPAMPPPDAGRERSRTKPRPRASVPPAPAPAAVPTPTRAVDAPTGSVVPALAPRRPMLAGLGTPRDQRHSMVVAAVLGPCRALDPY